MTRVDAPDDWSVDADLDGDEHGDDDGDDAAAFESLFVSRLSSRQRLVRLGIIAGGPLVALLVIFGSLFSVPQRVALALRNPTPARTMPAPGQDALYLDVDAPWLTVTLDGHPLSVPAIGRQPPVHLSPGHHDIAWLGAPFRAQDCVLSVPRAPGDTCLPLMEGMYWAEGEPVAQVVHLGEWLATVQPGQRDSLVLALQAALDPLGGSETVQPGETYLRSDAGPTVASQSLRATLAFHLVADVTGGADPSCHTSAPSFDTLTCLSDPAYCQRLCTVPWLLRHALGMHLTAGAWQVLTIYTPVWNYATADGRTVALDQPVENGGRGVSTQILPVTLTWTTARGWQVTPDASFAAAPLAGDGPSLGGNPSCVAAEDLVGGGIVAHAVASAPIRVVSAPSPAQGCLLVVSSDAAASGDASEGPVPAAYYLERFGMFLAANDRAALLAPQAPRANAYEQALAQQLAALPGQELPLP